MVKLNPEERTMLATARAAVGRGAAVCMFRRLVRGFDCSMKAGAVSQTRMAHGLAAWTSVHRNPLFSGLRNMSTASKSEPTSVDSTSADASSQASDNEMSEIMKRVLSLDNASQEEKNQYRLRQVGA